jgi:hypothetical protein
MGSSGAGQDRLVGIAEIAELAGSSRQAITNLRARDDGFPLSLADLRSGPVFRWADIEVYLASRGRALPPAGPSESSARGPEKFDPLTPLNLARSVERALLDEPVQPLPLDGTFSGGGVYCIYYSGPYEPYAPIVGDSAQMPLYVGSATQGGKGMSGVLPSADRPVLLNRLREHARTLEQAEDLVLDDFSCRFIIADDLWAPSAAALLVHHFRPLWNTVVEGFGNHDPGAGRYGRVRPAWDELHPGRSWAARMGPASRDRAEILQAVADHLREARPPDFSSVPRADAQARWYFLWPRAALSSLRDGTRLP